MNESAQIAASPAAATLRPTALTDFLLEQNPTLLPQGHAGALTLPSFTGADQELPTLLHHCGVYDLGYRTRIAISGEDRLRWLNGMVTNAIQTLAIGSGNYNFILNAQGKIQGDANIYRSEERLLLDTDRSQAEKLTQHLDHFIIMDDVELHDLSSATTGLGVAGPDSARILGSLGLDEVNRLDDFQFVSTSLHGIPITLVRGFHRLVPRFELWFSPSQVEAVWNLLLNAGTLPCGTAATEALRILEGTPVYGADIQDRHLPQETSQTRALNFNKGCYLGQEIVERIRSRTTVHRSLHQFQLSSSEALSDQDLPIELKTAGEERPVGQLTSIATYRLPEFQGTLALGYVRNEVLERKAPLEFPGGTATALGRPPVPLGD